MQAYYCQEKVRDKQGAIVGYRLLDQTGQPVEVGAAELKDAIASGRATVSNLKLTSDFKLIDAKNSSVSVEANLQLANAIAKQLSAKLDSNGNIYNTVVEAYPITDAPIKIPTVVISVHNGIVDRGIGKSKTDIHVNPKLGSVTGRIGIAIYAANKSKRGTTDMVLKDVTVYVGEVKEQGGNYIIDSSSEFFNNANVYLNNILDRLEASVAAKDLSSEIDFHRGKNIKEVPLAKISEKFTKTLFVNFVSILMEVDNMKQLANAQNNIDGINFKASTDGNYDSAVLNEHLNQIKAGELDAHEAEKSLGVGEQTKPKKGGIFGMFNR